MEAAELLALHGCWTDNEDRHDLSEHSGFMRDDVIIWTLGGEKIEVAQLGFVSGQNAPNGPIEMRAASNLRVKDGKVIESWIYADPGDARSVGGA